MAELLDDLIAAGDLPQMTPMRPLAVLAALDVGKEELARALIARWGAELRDDWSGDFVVPIWGLIAARLGAPDPEELYEILLPVADQLIVMGMGSAAWGSIRDVLAALAVRLGRAEEADEHRRAAIDTHRRLGLTYWEARSRS